MPYQQQAADLQDDSALFALALGPATRSSVVLCGGSTRGFADISFLYEVWHDLNIPVSLITPPGLERFIPAGVSHAVGESLNRSVPATATAWSLIDAAGVVIVGPNLQLTSAQQVFYSRLLPFVTVPTVLTDEALSLWGIDGAIRGNHAIVWLASVRSALRVAGGALKPERGIFGMQDFMQSLPTAAEVSILYDAIYVYSYVRATDTLIYTALIGPEIEARNLLLSLLPVTLYSRSRGVSLESRVKVLHALFAQVSDSYSQQPDELARRIKKSLR